MDINDNPLEKFRGRFDNLGIKVGVSSYVWPAGYSDNVRRLKGIVGEVQLLAYEPMEKSPVSDAEIAILGELKTGGISYSLHLPVPTGMALPGGTPEAAVAGVISRFKPLGIASYVLHVEKNGGTFDTRLAAERIARILQTTGVEPKTMCVENLIGTPFNEVWDSVEDLGVSLCFDIGHLLCEGGDPLSFMEMYGKHMRMAHIHGVAERDHRPLWHIPPELFGNIIKKLAGLKLEGAMIIENFSLEDIAQSLECLARYDATSTGRAQ